MTNEHKKALECVKTIGDKDILNVYIDKCLIKEEEVEMLRRYLFKGHSQIKIAYDMGYDKDTVNRKISKSLKVLQKVIEIYTT